MICSECGTRIPDELLQQQSFACPECGAEYERAPQPKRPNRYAEFAREARYNQRYDDRYDDRYEDDVYPENDQDYPDDHPADYPEDYQNDYPQEDYGEQQPRTFMDMLRELPYYPWFKPAVAGLAALVIIIVALVVILNRPSAGERSVSNYVEMLRKGGLPIGEVVVYNKNTDPNGLLGQDNQYTGKATFADTRLEQVEGSEPNGGTIEVFANNEDMRARKEFITSMADASPDPAPYVYESSDGLALVRLSTDISADEAVKYDDVLHGKSVLPGVIEALPTATSEPAATEVPAATQTPTAVYSGVRVPAGKYVIGQRFPVGTYTIRVDNSATSCIVSLYETTTDSNPFAVYELSTLGSTTVENLQLRDGMGIIIEGDDLICDVYQ